MIRKILAAILSLLATAAIAAVDVNKATQADLESIQGIGPVIAAKILAERKKGAFKDWNDMVIRVKGIREGNATKYSADGLRVNGAAFAGTPRTHAKPEGNPTLKPDAKRPTAATEAGRATRPAATAKRAAEAGAPAAASAPAKKK